MNTLAMEAALQTKERHMGKERKRKKERQEKALIRGRGR
jgi:hypothetical protein